MAAIALLIAELSSREEIPRRNAIIELVNAGPIAIAPLINALDDTWPLTRGSAALALGKLSEHAESERAVQKLGMMLGDESEFARKCAADALVQYDDWAEQVLVEALSENDNPQKQGWAAYAICQIARPIEAAIVPLVPLLVHEDFFVRRQSARALISAANCPVELAVTLNGKLGERHIVNLRTNDAVELLVGLLRFATEHDAVDFAEALICSLRETGDTSDEVYSVFLNAVRLSGRGQSRALEALLEISPETVIRRNQKSVTLKNIRTWPW